MKNNGTINNRLHSQGENSFSKSRLIGILYSLMSIVFWLSLWEILAHTLDLSFALPTVEGTFLTLIRLSVTAAFWKTVFFSLLRILTGFIFGITLGIILSALTVRFKAANAIVSPAMTIIKATPVASFIMVLWVIIGSNSVPSAIAVLMVLPIIWQNLTAGYGAIDRSLSEVCDIFKLSYSRRLSVLVIPTLADYFLPAVTASASLAWKAGIAAEIIAYTKTSIGREIFEAKSYFEGEKMFAWTIAVIILSLVFEHLIKLIGRKAKKNGNQSF